MRELTSHKANGVNNGLKVLVLDEPGPGGACHRYHVTTTEYPPPVGGGMSHADLEKATAMNGAAHEIRFQKGPIHEAHVNGLTHEVLLAVLIDRLEGFQAGPFACRANGKALLSLRDALEALLSRTRERANRI